MSITHCNACNIELIPVIEGDLAHLTHRYKDAIDFTFFGGPGMFFNTVLTDNGDDIDMIESVLCVTCFSRFLDHNPWVMALFEKFDALHKYVPDSDLVIGT